MTPAEKNYWLQPRKSTVRLSIPSQLGYEKIAMAATRVVAQELGIPQDKTENLRTAVSEACLNAMQHGNQFSSRRFVKIIFRIRGKYLQVDIQDTGRGLKGDPPRPNLDRKLAGKEPARGWGVFLMEHLVDRVEFLPLKYRGHITRLILNLPR